MLFQALVLAMAAAAPLAHAEEVGDICALPIRVGPCKAAIPRFGFSTKTGKCERFTFGGCKGNANNFKTIAECKAACPPPPTPAEVCTLPIEEGPCKASIARFGFNPETGTCEKFAFGGCKGNKNNFETRKACEALCAAPPPPPTPEEICAEPIVKGPCKAAIPRFGFNPKAGKCEEFIFGGCKGNANNFKTLKECKLTCPPPPPPPTPEEICALPLVKGPCNANKSKFGFNSKTGKCELFTFGGCKGNANNFDTLRECKALCSPPPPKVAEEVCPLPFVKGPCKAAIPRFGFNSKTGKCERFIFGGCKGNGNNFETLEDCEALCAPPPPPAPPAKIDCTLPLLTGPCRGAFPRWGFIPRQRQCVKFTYGGCAGNENNFETERECLKACRPTLG